MSAIQIDEQAPRWLRELGRFLPLKSILFLDGNVNDLISYPVQSETGEAYWVESPLRPFFERLFQGLGYEIVGFVDPLEELQFVTAEMGEQFRSLSCAQPAGATPGQAAAPAAEGRAGAALARPDLVPHPAGGPGGGARGAEEGRSSVRRPPEWNRTIDQIGAAVRNAKGGCAIVVQFASRLLTSPEMLDDAQRTLFTKLLRISLEAPLPGRGACNNVVVLLCDKLNDLPAFLYLNNPRGRSIHLDLPDRNDRERFLRRSWPGFHGAAREKGPPPEAAVREFVDLTDGLTNYELRSLVRLSEREAIPVWHPISGACNVRAIIEQLKYGVTESRWEQIDQQLNSAAMALRQAIHGQDEAVERCLEVICRARYGLAAGEGHRSNRPRGVLFFAGPTGVGKTEMAKALAKAVFGQAERLVRFDMSEYRAEHADQRLLGAPPGYTGYDEGGQLTDAVKKQPFSLLLFDEIEKAHPLILDKFLQILDDGRLTDGRGETAYFSESVIIFTSNLGILPMRDPEEDEMVTPAIAHAEMKEIVLRRIGKYFTHHLGRPELLNRFGDSFVVFDFIRPPHHAEIVRGMVAQLVTAAAERGRLGLEIEEPVYEQLIEAAVSTLANGGRGIRNLIDSALVNPLARALAEMQLQSPATVRVLELFLNPEEGGRPTLKLELEER